MGLLMRKYQCGYECVRWRRGRGIGRALLPFSHGGVWLMMFREEMRAPEEYTYLNTAATSPLPRFVCGAVDSFMESRARCAECAWDAWMEHVTLARDRVAALIGASRDEIAFLKNTGEGLNTACAMMGPRGEVVTTGEEFPSNFLPWAASHRTVRTVAPREDGQYLVEDFEEAIGTQTSVVSLSEVTYTTGARLPTKDIASLAHDNGALVVSDAVQALGAVRMDVRELGIDILCCGGHKWLMSPFGVGIFYLSSELLDRYDPPYVGWASLEDDTDFSLSNTRLAASARKVEIGNLNFAGIYGLSASVGAMLAYGPDRLEDEVLTLAGYLKKRLGAAGLAVTTPPKDQAGIVSYRSAHPAQTVSALMRRRIVVAERGGVRISPHVWNTKEELDAAVEAIVEVEEA